ncbi:nitroreductase family deazaflavin-dependent oxidoreductase [Georgenia alba]|uniref:Nitroreductase family deazaflavin-dependent oxidoreductase n=1 Tax=Georgenia alba TaxID=2233858 RepID=A0ABW2Q8I3_9MICO
MRRIPRPLARAPIALFRAGLGALLGDTAVMVEHRGRRSGLPRHVVLEVLVAEPDAVVVVSGYGERAQWFRNVRVDPRVRLWWGRARGVLALAEVLDASAGRELLETYRRLHPWRSRFVARVLDLPALGDPRPLPHDIGETVRLVRISRVTT